METLTVDCYSVPGVTVSFMAARGCSCTLFPALSPSFNNKFKGPVSVTVGFVVFVVVCLFCFVWL